MVKSDYAAFWRSLDPDTQQVIRQMDEHENLGHADSGGVSEQMVQLLSRVHRDLERIARHIAGSEGDVEHHIETLMLIMSFAPNGASYWVTKALAENQPEIYRFIFERVLTQKPLQMHAKLIRERLLFYLGREQVRHFIFSPETALVIKTAMEDLKRA